VTDDRRANPRVPLRSEAEVRFLSWEVFRLIYTINISQGGMTLEVGPEEPKVGAELTVKLSLPKGPPIELHAVVKHVTSTTSTKPLPEGAPPPPKKFQIGVQFQNLDATKKSAIETTIRAHGGMGGAVGLTRKKEK
jgi:hypothetical protein